MRTNAQLLWMTAGLQLWWQLVCAGRQLSPQLRSGCEKIANPLTCWLVKSTKAVCMVGYFWWTFSLLTWPSLLNHSAPAFPARHSSSLRNGCLMSPRHWTSLACHLLKGEPLYIYISPTLVGETKFCWYSDLQLQAHLLFIPVWLRYYDTSISIQPFLKTSIYHFLSPASLWAKR